MNYKIFWCLSLIMTALLAAACTVNEETVIPEATTTQSPATVNLKTGTPIIIETEIENETQEVPAEELDALMNIFGNEPFIAFFCGANADSLDRNLAITNSAGDKFRLLTDEMKGLSNFSISPDGTYIAYETDSGVWIVRPDGSDNRLIYPLGSFPKWSPDPGEIALRWSLMPLDIILVDLNGQMIRNITEDDASDNIFTWSPDGKYIAYKTDHPSGEDQTVAIKEASGQGERVVVNMEPVTIASYPSWSPDSKYIVFTYATKDIPRILAVASTDGRNVREIGLGSNPAWSPEGDQITFSLNNHGIDEIWVVNSDGTNRRKIDEGSYPSWSPDGKSIAYYKMGIENSGLWLANVVDGNSSLVVSCQGIIALHPPQWSK